MLKNKRSRYILLFLCFLTISFIGCSLEREDTTTNSSNDQIIIRTSAKEALELAYDNAKQVMEAPLFYSISSTDATDFPQSITEGQDGKRIAWNVFFGNREGTQLVDCQIQNGKSTIIFFDKKQEIYKKVSIYQTI